jgi:hypothetical protein
MTADSFEWKKGGLLIRAAELGGPAASHAQVPTPIVMDERIRVYFAPRDSGGRSYTAFAEVDVRDPGRVLKISAEPVIPHGAPGTFDDEGLMPSCVIHDGGRWRLYYSGWNQRKTVPYHNATGVAFSSDGGACFKRDFHGPILDRCAQEPYVAVTPCVLAEGPLWRMWYVSGLRWEEFAGRYEPIYVIKYAESDDGIAWRRSNHTCIPQRYDDEAFSRPWVLKLGDSYHMWYCYRRSMEYRDGPGSYRLGYAISQDGSAWRRCDDLVGISVASTGWDSTMICYPAVARTNRGLVMFYNGNGFGREGFGYATAELPNDEHQG